MENLRSKPFWDRSPLESLADGYKKLPRNFKLCMLATFIIGLAAHMYCYTNMLTGADDAFLFSDTRTFADGASGTRWLLAIYFALIKTIRMPWLLGVMTLLLYGVAAWLVCETLSITSSVGIILVSGLMVTSPSTHGVFESRIREIVDAVHDAGGQVYMDGANMNAQVGLTNPGYIGADVCHLNLHKTFAMPHGGGGPGVGPICVAEHLRAFLPSHPVMPTGGDEGITAVASAPWGSAMLLPITYGYIKMLGGNGLRRATEMAIVNANYMSSALAPEYRTYYSGETGRVGHEMILDLTSFKKDYNIDCGDIAHRLMDYGFHAPTLSFPVHETLMVEPTESEPKAEMDRFIEALVSIKRECEAAAGQADNVVANAPHTAVEIAGEWTHPYTRAEAAFPLAWVREAKFFPYVTKIDNGYGDRNLCCRNCE